MSRILCIDDEVAILRLLNIVLSQDGHDVVGVSRWADAQAAFGKAEFDAILLDLGLPDRDGLELIPAIQKISAAPILVVSARNDTAEKVAALDLGAGDYVTKPFDGDEVRARLRVALRGSHTAAQSGPVLRHGPICMIPASLEADISGRPLDLTPKEYAVLRALVEAAGRIITHRALLERV